MFKQIFRLTFVTFIWKQYKRTIVSTIALLIFLWLVNFAHAEYLSFAEFQAGKTHIGLSFFIKWMLLILGVLIYLAYSLLRPKYRKKTGSIKKQRHESIAKEDPFALIREKKKLRSRADIMLEKQGKPNKTK